MKSLQEYTEKEASQLFESSGAFWAFSDKQFNEQKKEGVKYCSIGAGLICPVENAKSLSEGMEKIHKEGVVKRLKECGLDAIIEYELANHEAWYTWEVDDAFLVCKEYGATLDDMIRVHRANAHKYED